MPVSATFQLNSAIYNEIIGTTHSKSRLSSENVNQLIVPSMQKTFKHGGSYAIILLEKGVYVSYSEYHLRMGIEFSYEVRTSKGVLQWPLPDPK